jgi:hypothetical protein
MSKKQKPAGKPVVKEATFVYLCDCHKEAAKKPPVAMPQGKGIGTYVGAKTEGDATLGKWRCSVTGKKCTVRPTTKSVAVPVQETL